MYFFHNQTDKNNLKAFHNEKYFMQDNSNFDSSLQLLQSLCANQSNRSTCWAWFARRTQFLSFK